MQLRSVQTPSGSLPDPVVLEDDILETESNAGTWGVLLGFTLGATLSICSPHGTLCGGCNWGTAGYC